MQHETLVVSGEFDTVDHLLAAAAAQQGERDAYVGPDDRMSFAEWHLRSDLVAEELRRRGVGRGDVVALVMPNSCDFAVVFAAIAKLGAVTTALNTRLGPQEMEAIAQTCLPRLVVRDGTLATRRCPASRGPSFAPSWRGSTLAWRSTRRVASATPPTRS